MGEREDRALTGHKAQAEGVIKGTAAIIAHNPVRRSAMTQVHQEN